MNNQLINHMPSGLNYTLYKFYQIVVSPITTTITCHPHIMIFM